MDGRIRWAFLGFRVILDEEDLLRNFSVVGALRMANKIEKPGKLPFSSFLALLVKESWADFDTFEWLAVLVKMVPADLCVLPVVAAFFLVIRSFFSETS